MIDAIIIQTRMYTRTKVLHSGAIDISFLEAMTLSDISTYVPRGKHTQ